MTDSDPSLTLKPVGIVRSPLTRRSDAPKQGDEGAPDAWLDIADAAAEGLDGLQPGDRVIVLTWLDRASREVLKVRPRGRKDLEPTGVFTTRSPDRPNPIGLHEVTVHERVGNRLRVGPLEAIDGTPVLDIKPTRC